MTASDNDLNKSLALSDMNIATSNYYDTQCHTCGTDITVKTTDRAPRAYCSACAMAKFAEPIHIGTYQQQELQ